MNGFYDRFIHKYPYTDLHELNLDWLIKAVKDIAYEVHNWELVNEISYQGSWDITKQYPAWSIVTVNGTIGYISKQPVPVGVDYTNNDYWVLVADYTVQLAGLGDRVADLEIDMAAAQGDITSLQALTTWLKGQLTNSTKKVICISDSYGLTPSTSNSWIPKFQQFYGISNANFYRDQGNGGGFVGFYPNLTFENLLRGIATTMSADEKTGVNEIIIGGGYNDADVVYQGQATHADVANAINSCITYIRSTFPNAKVYLVWLGWSNVNYAIHPYIRGMQNTYYQTAVKASKNISVIEGINWMHRKALADNTGYHPTAVCAEAIAMSLASILNGGTDMCDLAPWAGHGYIDVTVNRDTTSVSALTCTDLRQTYRSGTVFTSWRSIQFTIINSLGQANEVKLGDITDGCIVGGNGSFSGAMMPCMYKDGSDYYSGYLLIHDGGLYFGNVQSPINAGSTINIVYGAGATDVMM